MFRIGFVLITSVMLISICLLARPSATYHRAESVKYPPKSQTYREQIEMVGKYLAQWSEIHEKTISINGNPINIVDSTVFSLLVGLEDGYGLRCIKHKNVVFQSKSISPEQNETMRKNLEDAIERGICNKRLLTRYMDGIKSYGRMSEIEPERLAADLSCLGAVEFRTVW